MSGEQEGQPKKTGHESSGAPAADLEGTDYDAFLSYSHGDAEVAAAVQRGLHRVGRRMGQLRALRVYRDATDLAANPGFWSKLVDALDSARFFIAILSPSAAASEWVSREIAHWLTSRGSENLLIVLAEGSLVWDEEAGRFDPTRSTALPQSLAGANVFTDEPLYVDLSELSDQDLSDLRHGQFRSKVVDLAAPIHGKPKDVLESEDRRELRTFRRYRRIAVAALAVLTVAALVLAGLAVDQRNEAREQSREARASELAALAIVEEDPDRALVLAIEAEFATDSPSPAARSAFAAVTARYGRLPALAMGQGRDVHGGDVLDVAWSPDGTEVVSVGGDGSVLLLSAPWGNSTRALGNVEGPAFVGRSVDWSPDGELIAAGGQDGGIVVWQAGTGAVEEILSAATLADLSTIAWSPDSRWLAVGDSDGGVTVWDRATWSPVSPAGDDDSSRADAGPPRDGYKHDLAWSPSGRELVSSGANPGTATIFGLGRSESVGVVVDFGEARAVDWSPDGSLVAVAGSDGTIAVHDSTSGRFEWMFDVEDDWIDTIAFSPDGRMLASGGHDSKLRLFDVDSGRAIGEPLTSHQGWLNALDWSSDGSMVVTASTDRTLRFWEVSRASPAMELATTVGSVFDLAWSPEGSRVVTASSDGAVSIWAPTSGRELAATIGHDDIAGAASWSHDGRFVASGGDDGTVLIWDATSGELVRTIEAHPDVVYAVDWAPGDHRVASAGLDGTVRIWDVEDGREVSRLGSSDGYYSVTWSPDGSRVATGGIDGRLEIWSASNSALLAELALDGERVANTVVWSPSGDQLAGGYSDGAVRVWDVADGQIVYTLLGHNGEVLDLDWSPSGELIVSAGSDAALILWDVVGGRQLGPPLTSDDWKADVLAVGWSSDNRTIASAFSVGSAQVWEAMDESEACRLALRALGPNAILDLAGSEARCLTPETVQTFPELPTMLRRATG